MAAKTGCSAEGAQLGRDRLAALRSGLRGLAERAQDVPPGDDARDTVPVDDRDPPLVGLREHALQLLEALARFYAVGTRPLRSPSRARARARDRWRDRGLCPPSRRVTVVHDEHAALAVALAERHRLRDRLGRRDHARGLRHDVSGARRLLHGSWQRLEETASCVLELTAVDRRRRLLVATAAERSGGGCASNAGERLRVTQKTRRSISTSSTSARQSVRSTILWARFDTPST